MTSIRTRCAAALLAASMVVPVAATAQSGSLDSQRQAVFAQLIASPADRALMLAYARLSVQMRDFEAAAATLERFLDLDPGNTAARVELATAYFALGAYGVAQYHLAAAAASGGLTAEQAEQVARYRAETEARQAPHQITGGSRLASPGRARATRAGFSAPHNWTGASTWAGPMPMTG
jgi:predicted Zn-dependent protease